MFPPKPSVETSAVKPDLNLILEKRRRKNYKSGQSVFKIAFRFTFWPQKIMGFQSLLYSALLGASIIIVMNLFLSMPAIVPILPCTMFSHYCRLSVANHCHPIGQQAKGAGEGGCSVVRAAELFTTATKQVQWSKAHD